MTDTPAERPDPGVAGDADWAAQARPLLVHVDMRLCKRFDQVSRSSAWSRCAHARSTN